MVVTIWQLFWVDSFVVIDGQCVGPEQAVVSVFDRGFLYGDSVFETIATRGGKAVELAAHVARLVESAARVYIELPIAAADLEAEIRAAIGASGYSECSVRVTVTRGSGELGLDMTLASNPRRVLIVVPLRRPAPELYEQGIATVTFRTQRTAEATDAVGAKVGNYLVAVLAMRAARAAGAAEALILDAHGNVVEGATSNVFLVEGSTLVTPPVEAGILPGITRARILQIAAELALPVELCPIPLDRLLAGTEVFISSSIRELLPVVRVDSAVIGAGQPGTQTRSLLSEYQRRAAAIAQ